MGRAIDKLNAGKLDNCGIGHFAHVAVGTVTGMPVDGLRLFETARSLLVRLTWRLAAGQLAGNADCLRPVHAGATWTPEPASSGIVRSRLYERLGRPRSAIRAGKF